MAKVLLIAPGVDANDVGEAWVAYQWASRLSEHHSVTLLTYRKRGRQSAQSQLTQARVVEWNEPPILGRAERFNSLFKPWYVHFYLLCKRWIRTSLARGEVFDIGHQPVPVAMRYPSPLSGSGIPYVLGPVGGSMNTPVGFRNEDTAPWYMGFRRIDHLRLERDPLLRSSYSRASTVLGIAPYVAESLSSVPIARYEVMSETAVGHLPQKISRRPHAPPVRLLFVGRLIRTKGARDAIRALDKVRDLPVHLDIVGTGFDRATCQALVSRLELAQRVTFHGAINREQVDIFYRQADVFLFPSYREPGGNVPFEAMAHGLPMIVSDRGGPGYVVTDDCGIRITPRDPEQYATELASAIRTMVENEHLRVQMGVAARERVLQIGTWDSRMDQIDTVYSRVLQGPLLHPGP